MELKTYQTIAVTFNEGILGIELRRPAKGNSYNKLMLEELISVLSLMPKMPNLKILFLSSIGKNFCTGADLDWMSIASQLSEEENRKDFSLIPTMYHLLLNSPILIVTAVQGKTIGGGVGLVATSDYVIASENAEFSLKELNWGLIPGVITPMVCDKIGLTKFSEMSLTGKIITSADAYSYRLVHSVSSNLKKDSEEILRKLSQLPTKTLRSYKTTIKMSSHITQEHLNTLANFSAELRKDNYFCDKYNS